MTISARIIADSISSAGIRLATMQLRYPKFIHGEFMTHRVFSRNASSSRAIPVERLIKDVIDDPVYPSFWGKNKPGMQAHEEHSDPIVPPYTLLKDDKATRKQIWDLARDQAIGFARAYANAGYHKQIVNRLLEPFCHINVVVTATEWDNFFQLRCHPDAQPEMRELAEQMRQALGDSVPIELNSGQWHLPYVDHVDIDRADIACAVDEAHLLNTMIRVSVARCARVSYLTQDGNKPAIHDDLVLYEKLVGAVPLHASPAEHQATPDDKWMKPELHGNFRGWIQYRKQIER